MNKVEKSIFRKVNGNTVVIDEEIDSLGFSSNDKALLVKALNSLGIDRCSENDIITSEKRSTKVADCEYGEPKVEELDVPRYSEITYKGDQKIGSNHYELIKIINSDIIPKNLKYKKRKDYETGEDYLYPSIQLNKLLKYKLSDEELTFVINYLEDQNIEVCGVIPNFCFDFENYTNYRTYKSEKLKEVMPKDEFLALLNEYRMLEEEYKLCKDKDVIIKNRKRSREVLNAMFEGNLRLSRWCAYHYYTYFKNNNENVFADEINSYADEGLFQAIRKFDPSKGCEFSTFAVPCIKGYISRGLNIDRSINKYPMRIPINVLEQIKNLTKKFDAFENQVGRKFDITDEDDLNSLRIMMNMDDCTELLNCINLMKELERWYNSSLDEIDEENLVSLDSHVQADSLAMSNGLRESVFEVLATLTPRENKVLIERFGLLDGKQKTLEDVGEMIGATRERARQIEAKALRKLRHPSCYNKLAVFLGVEKSKKGDNNTFKSFYDALFGAETSNLVDNSDNSKVYKK